MKINSIVGRAIAVFLLLNGSARADDFLHTAGTTFFDEQAKTRRIGIEIEFGGVPDKDIIEALKKHFKVQQVRRVSDLETRLITDVGTIQIKVEGQAWRFENDPKKYAAQIAEDIKFAPREIVFPPLHYYHMPQIQAVGVELDARRAIGTRANHAVAYQVNVEMGDLKVSQSNVDLLVNLMRTYTDPDNARQKAERLGVPEIREEYLHDYSPGFEKRIRNPKYKPTAWGLYEDFMYRQSAELFNVKGAWTLPFPELQKQLMALKDPVHPRVMKMQKLRVSSLLLRAFPEDPLAKATIASRWARPAPIVEFREFNMIFEKMSEYTRQSLGVIRSVELFGSYSHDSLMSELTGITASDIRRIRNNARGKKLPIRYLLEDPKTAYMPVSDRQVDGSKALWIQLSPAEPGAYPLHVEGESTVFHRRHIHRSSIVGKYNPGLENGYIQQILENKLVEAKVFGKFAPGSMPEFAALRDLVEIAPGERPQIADVVRAVSRRFPQGWVMKGSWDLGTETAFISDKLDFAALEKAYENGFEAFHLNVLQTMAGRDPEAVQAELKKHPGYMGWKIKQTLKKPDQVFFQSRMEIDREFRVEVIGGKVLSEGSTIDRYSYLKRGKKGVPVGEATDVERFTQYVINQLPDELRYLPYGLDVARLKDGSFRLIETNPGGNSSFLEENYDSVKALEGYLAGYPQDVVRGRVPQLAPEAQMAWIAKTFRSLGVNPEKDYPGFIFAPDQIVDPEFLPKRYCHLRLMPGLIY